MSDLPKLALIPTTDGDHAIAWFSDQHATWFVILPQFIGTVGEDLMKRMVYLEPVETFNEGLIDAFRRQLGMEGDSDAA